MWKICWIFLCQFHPSRCLWETLLLWLLSLRHSGPVRFELEEMSIVWVHLVYWMEESLFWVFWVRDSSHDQLVQACLCWFVDDFQITTSHNIHLSILSRNLYCVIWRLAALAFTTALVNNCNSLTNCILTVGISLQPRSTIIQGNFLRTLDVLCPLQCVGLSPFFNACIAFGDPIINCLVSQGHHQRLWLCKISILQ